MPKLYRSILCWLAFLLTIDVAFAEHSDSAALPSQICGLLLQSMGEEIMIMSNDVGFIQNSSLAIYRTVPAKGQPLVEQLRKMSFGPKILEDIPQFRRAEWYEWNELVASEMQSRSGRNFIITINSHGIIEVKIMSSGGLIEDRANSEEVIALLQREGVKAVLSAKTSMLPYDPRYGFELWISRLDMSNSINRIGTAKLIEFLKDN